MRDRFDVVILGSGAGGAPIAHRLALAGKSVLVLEKGPLISPQYLDPRGVSEFKRDELLATGSEKRIGHPLANQGEPFYNSHIEPDLNDEPHVYRGADSRDRITIEGYTAQAVGGGTNLYGAVSLRFTPDDLRLATFNAGRTDLRADPAGDVEREARDWPIDYDTLEPYYSEMERLLGINGTRQNQAKPFSADHYQPPLPPNAISRYVEIGMDALGLPRYRTPLAVITEDHAPSGRKAYPPKTGYVNRYGDPLGLKSSTWVALLAPILGTTDLTIRPNCVATHLEAAGGRVSKVHYRDPGGTVRTAEGRLVVVACSAIESVRLLQLSGRLDAAFAARIDPHGLLGAYFLTHCFGGAEVRVPGVFDKSVSLDSDWATDACAAASFIRENGLWAGGAIYNNTSDQALPIALARTHGSQDLDTIWKTFVDDTGMTGERLRQWLESDFGRRLSVSFMANQVPQRSNRIELHPTVRDKWDRPVAYIVKGWHGHDRYLMDTLAEQCARVLRFGCDGGQGNYPVHEKGGVYQAENGLARIANHVLGGARFGNDATDSVLDPDCRAWGFDNLFVTDGAFMPTSGSANPTLTIEANSLRVADRLLARI